MTTINTRWAEHIALEVHGRNWISNRFVAIRADLLRIDADDISGKVAKVDPDKFPSEATFPTEGPIGIHTAAVLWRNPGMVATDSDRPGMHMLTMGGEVVGFATEGAPDSSFDVRAADLPQLFKVADVLVDYVHDDPTPWGGGEGRDDEFLFAAAAKVIDALSPARQQAKEQA